MYKPTRVCKNAFDAEHFPLENVMLNILLRKMWCVAKMHFCIKCIFAQLNIFLWKMYAEHFPLENVRQNAFWHQMHFCIKCICNILCYKMYASNAFLHSWTFSFGKCTLNIFQRKMYAEHFPLENVRQNAFWHQMHFCIKCICNILCYKMYASNAFLHQMHFCIAEHFPLENVRVASHFPLENVTQKCIFAQQKCIFASNAFVTFCFAKMHFCTNKMWCWTFSKGKCDAKMHFCTAEHFPLENVRQNAFLHQMHFCIKYIFAKHQMHFGIKCIFASNAFLHSWTFSKGKCDAEHFPKENVRKNIFASNAFLHSVAEHFPFGKCSAPTKCDALLCFAKIHFCIKYIFALPLFFAVQKTQQHQIHFCTAFVFCCAKNTAASNTFVTFCFAEHFPLENVQRTFSFGKCSASHFVGAEHFPLENVMLNILQRKMWCNHGICLYVVKTRHFLE